MICLRASSVSKSLTKLEIAAAYEITAHPRNVCDSAVKWRSIDGTLYGGAGEPVHLIKAIQ
jgi:hypothetical protein